jgi:hypothetical protein
MGLLFSQPIEVSPRKWLLVPAGIKVREFEGRAYFAFEAAEHGWGVIFGAGVFGDRSEFPSGILLEANVAPDAKFDLASDETGALVAKIGTEGEATGNPRYDLYRPELRGIFEKRVERLKAEHGPFILLNTKFSFANGFFSVEGRLDKMRRRQRLRSAEQESELRDRVTYHQAGFDKFMELVDELSHRFPTHSVVIRPHPYEQIEPWQQKAVSLPNVKAIREGSAAGWILASEACIHTNCTTGVEAYLLGKDSISYRPLRDARFDQVLPNALSVEAFNAESVVELVAAALDGEPIVDAEAAAQKAELARRCIPNVEGECASEKILDALRAVDAPEVALSYGASRMNALEEAVRRNVRLLQSLVEGGEQGRRSRHWERKSDGVNKTELLDWLAAVQGVTGRFGGVKIAQMKQKVFCVY